YTIRADRKDPIQEAVDSTSVPAIIKTFPVTAWGKDRAAVIEVTDLFKGDLPEFSARRILGTSSLDPQRSFVNEIKAFENNIETKVLATYTLSGPSSSSTSGVTTLLHHSMVRLPEKPMKPRLHDNRVGFFTVQFEDYSRDQRHQVENIKYITRWRLEKKEPDAELSEPVKPIVFYVGRGVPQKWKPWIKKGIEMWNPAFEKAGFRNALQAQYAPSRRENPNWDAEDARISTIRWLPSSIENAYGPHVHDPRSGEILEADIRMHHNVMKLLRDWYFVQASPSDTRAQTLPLPDELMGELLSFVVAHEVGHSIGLPHNMKASSSYRVDQLRDPHFTRKHGTAPSIMDYARFNYVAQPEDGASLIPRIGPYDFFSIQWGYTQFPEKDDEKQSLEQLLKKQVQDPMLRFGANPNQDPSQQTEDLGSDAIVATELGLKNLSRVCDFLIAATCKPGEDYSLLRNMYEEILQQRSRELGHVVNLVGGFTQENLWYGDANQVYFAVASEQQRKAVAFLSQHAFQAPTELISPEITRRLEPSGAADRILSHQRRILLQLISESRIKQMSEHCERMNDQNTYAPAAMLGDIRDGIWTELNQKPGHINLYRRNLQRLHVDHLATFISNKPTASDLPSLARADLRKLLTALKTLPGTDQNPVTAAHLADITVRIQTVLDPNGTHSSP
ncbi:MAG: zinc-dependent metalloprotease, partial [Planctomycetes bacterium]|nr:zinc-dependent metalloprotease [Planctomycetota bacterium]